MAYVYSIEKMMDKIGKMLQICLAVQRGLIEARYSMTILWIALLVEGGGWQNDL